MEYKQFIEILEELRMKDEAFCHLPECQLQDSNDLLCDCGVKQRNDVYDIIREKQNQKIDEAISNMKKEITIFICEDERARKEIIEKYFSENMEITYVNILPAEKRSEIVKAIEELEK